jgi:hypothetical protein
MAQVPKVLPELIEQVLLTLPPGSGGDRLQTGPENLKRLLVPHLEIASRLSHLSQLLVGEPIPRSQASEEAL